MWIDTLLFRSLVTNWETLKMNLHVMSQVSKC